MNISRAGTASGNRGPTRQPGPLIALLLLAVLSGFGTEAHAQKMRNRGTIVNRGTLAVVDSVIGMPSTIGGRVTLFGGAQLVPASRYDDLSLTSPAVTTKQAAGSMTVLKELLIGSTVTLQVPADSVITLGLATGRLTEQGYVSGKIQKTVDLSGATTSSDFGGIGVSVAWAGIAPGTTTITRTSGTAVAVLGKTSIKRFYDVSAAIGGKADIVFSYTTDELQGQDPSTLDLWRLPAGDTQWRRQRVTRAGTTLTKIGTATDGRFTAADISNPLNTITKFEFESDAIASAGVDSAQGNRGAFVDSLFKAKVIDAFGQPVDGVTINFAVTTKPAGASQDSLTVVSGTTGPDGTVATQLRLGNLTGRYIVTATLPTEPTIAAKEWIGYTKTAVTTIAKYSGDGQSDTVRSVFSIPIAVRLSDDLDAAATGSPVQFRIISTPVGGENAALSDSIAYTDGLGVAGTGMVLGSKVGTYVIEAQSIELDSLIEIFTVTATHGAPTTFSIFAASLQDTVLNQLSPYSATVTDTHGNPVPGIPIRFALSSSPAGSAGAALSDTSDVTDSTGTATTQFTFGDRSGIYTVAATSTTLPGVTRNFVATATPSVPVLLALERGAVQRKQVLTQADTLLRVRASDAFGNPVPNVIVQFALTGAPAGATGQSFATADTTDALGIAETPFVVGTKVGPYSLTASASAIGGSSVPFEVTGTNGPANSFQFLASSAQGVVRSVVAPVSIAMRDAQGNPVPNAMVHFAIAATPAGATGHGVSVDSILTDSSGLASVSVTLGDRTGLYSLTAQSASFSGPIPSIAITATPEQAGLLVSVQGVSQQQQILRMADSALVVQVADSLGNLVSGVAVNFSIVSAPTGASQQLLTAASDTSDVNGMAETTLRLGTKIGHYVVAASTPSLGGTQVFFDILATHGAASDLWTAAPVTQDTVARQLTPFTVAVVDSQGNPIPNAIVRFALTASPTGASGQSLETTTATTDSAGQVSVRLTLGDKVGTYTVTATSDILPGLTRSFQANAIAAGAATIAQQVGGGQQQQILTSLGTAFTTRVLDRFGNPVQGVPVRFSVVDSPATAIGQSLTRSVDTTDINGVASTTMRLGLKVGVYSVEADVPGVVPVRFTALALAGSPRSSVAAPSDTVGFVQTALNPFVVTVRDTGDNLVPNAIVRFETISVPNGAGGYSLTTMSATTDSLGRAFSTFQLGDQQGLYMVLATVNNLPSHLFTVEARGLVGNPNFDMRVDVADLTAIIDHILGRSTLTGMAFRAADLDTSGTVDVRDAVICRNYILSGGTWNVVDSSLRTVPYLSLIEDRAMNTAPFAQPSSPGGTEEQVSASSAANTIAVLEFTSVGMRVNLANDVPVKGLEVYVRLKRPVPPMKGDVRFPRGRSMDIFVVGGSNEVRAVAFNFQNAPIDSGVGAIFRIPIAGIDTSDVDSIAVIVSTGSGNTSTIISGPQAVKAVGNYPTTFSLYQNYPNPFNSETFIEYDVPEILGRVPRVAIQIFNIVGEKVRTIDRQDRDAGRYKIRWDGRDERGASVATGVYFYRLLSVDPVEGNHFATTKKMIMVK